MATLPQPEFKVFYQGKNITADLTKNLLRIRYTDKVKGESDDIEITLEDTDGLWQNDWYPEKGDRIKLQMGYVGSLLDCGEFEVDETELGGPPDVFSIRAIASWVTTPMRTKDTKAHENKTLREIAQFVASKHGLTLIGKIYTIRIARSTQNNEPDLAYLERLSNQFGYVFSIRGSQLIFTSIYELEDGRPVKTINKSDCTSYSILDKTSETYSSAKVKYHSPKAKEVVEYEVKTEKNADGVAFGKVVKKDILYIKERAENKQQAELMAKSALHSKNSMQQILRFTIFGDPLLVAGNNIEAVGFGRNSGKYHIIQSTHSGDKQTGYVTECECKRVGFVQKVNQKAVKKRKSKPVSYTVIK